MKYAKSCSISGRILFLNSKPFSHPEKGVLQTLISHLRWKAWWHVLMSAKEMEASLPVVLRIWLLPQQCLVRTEQTQDSAYSSLPPPSILLSSHNLCIISTIPCLRDQATPLFVVSSFCQPTTSSTFVRIIPLRWRLPSTAYPPASADLLHLPLSQRLFPLRRCGSGGRGPFLPRVGQGEAQGESISWGCKTSVAAASSSRMSRSCPEMNGQSPDAKKASA